MRNTSVCRSWVVYRMTLPKNVTGGNVVCERREWDAIEAARPGLHTLLHADIGSEPEAERLARGIAAVPAPAARKVAGIAPLYATTISPARGRARANAA